MVWHLSVIELLELRDGALTKKKSHRLKVHLEACRSCRSKASQIEENLRQFSAATIQDPSVASRVEAAAMNVQKAIRTRRQTQTADPTKDRRNSGDSETRAQLVSELETYVGSHLTRELFREFDLGQDKDLELFHKIGPMLTALLGQESSLEVTTRLYRILVLDRRFGSACPNLPIEGVDKA